MLGAKLRGHFNDYISVLRFLIDMALHINKIIVRIDINPMEWFQCPEV